MVQQCVTANTEPIKEELVMERNNATQTQSLGDTTQTQSLGDTTQTYFRTRK